MLILIISIILMVAGILGSILPLIPGGVPVSYAGYLLYAISTNFNKISVFYLVLFGILTLLTVIIDFTAPMLGAKGYKASKWGIIGSMLGVMTGFIIGPWGIIIGPFIGGFIGEFLYNKDANKALKAAWGSFVGFFLSIVFRTAVVLAMLVHFIYALF